MKSSLGDFNFTQGSMGRANSLHALFLRLDKVCVPQAFPLISKGLSSLESNWRMDTPWLTTTFRRSPPYIWSSGSGAEHRYAKGKPFGHMTGPVCIGRHSFVIIQIQILCGQQVVAFLERPEMAMQPSESRVYAPLLLLRYLEHTSDKLIGKEI